MSVSAIVPPAFALVFAPLLIGVTNRTKAVFAGRQGAPLLQPYFDLVKLLGKGAVYSQTTTLVFRLGPMIGLAAVLTASLLMPFGGCRAPLAFGGDLILFVYVMGLARLFTVLAALDTGSSFEGMGASREVLFSTLAEPALLLALSAVGRETETLSLSQMHDLLPRLFWGHSSLILMLVAIVLFIVLLAENSRIPIDDPNTHLELTMIHEVMVLDHGGPDLAFIVYSAALKLWLLGSLIVGLLLPTRTGLRLVDLLLSLAAMAGVAVLIGVVESTMARFRMMRVPVFLVGAVVLGAVALILKYGGRLG